MATLDLIIHLFCLVDDRMQGERKHSQAVLYPSELVTIGILGALKGGHFRAFYRWLKRDYAGLFRGLPDRTRLQRLLKTHQAWFECCMADPTFFTVIDSYPIELIFPIREGRSPQQVGRKGKDKGRWTVGIKFCWLLNNCGQVIAWDWAPLDTPDNYFQPLVARFAGQTITLSDTAFHRKDGDPDNLTLCPKGTWNERMCVETALSMITVICDLKRVHHRLAPSIQARLAAVVAMFNLLLTLFHQLHPDADPTQMSIAEFSL
jgi:hypothetical protein